MVVEDFLVQTFGRMEIQSMSYNDRRSVGHHGPLFNESARAASTMPESFRDLAEARVYLDLIMRRQMYFIGTIARTIIKFSYFPPGYEDTATFGSTEDYQSMSSSKVRKQSIEMYKESLRWSGAFGPLLARLSLPITTNMDKITTLTMNIAASSSRACASGILTGLETQYDTQVDIFRLVVAQTTQLLALQEEESRKSDTRSETDTSFVFSFELGVITPLSLVIVKCRDPRIRRDALNLLYKYPRREGVWDSVITAALGRWVINMEEEWEGLNDPWDGVAEIWLPENKRLRGVSVRYDQVHKKVITSGLQFNAREGRWFMRSEEHRCETWRLDEYLGC